MAQTVQILRTSTNNPPPALLPGALSVELGTQTKLWVGAAGGNRLLMSSDPNDIALSSSCVVAATPPANPIPGLLWWDATGGQLYVRYQDANSTAWVAAASATGSFLPISGGTLTGPLILAAPPLVPLEAATKGYVDGFLPLAGGTLTGGIGIAPAGSAAFALRKSASGQTNDIQGYTGGSLRWLMRLGDATAESSGAGSNFTLGRYNDTGAFIDNPLVIYRSNGAVQVGGTSLLVAPPSGIDAQVYIDKPANTNNILIGLRGAGGVSRWTLVVDNAAESGSNAGSNFMIGRYSDAGAFISTPLVINRATGYAVFAENLGTGNRSVPVGSISGTICSGATVMGSHYAHNTTFYNGQWRFFTNSEVNVWTMDGPNVNLYQCSTPGAVGASVGLTVRMTVRGSDGACLNTSGTWSALSDANLKTEITDYSRGLADVLQLQPRHFRYTGALDDGEVHQGFIAQEMEAVFPELVGEAEGLDPPAYDEEGKALPRTTPSVKTVDPTATIYAVINAIKELNAEIQALKAGAP